MNLFDNVIDEEVLNNLSITELALIRQILSKEDNQMNTEQNCPCDDSDFLSCKSPTHPDEWYHINTIKDEDEDIRDYLTLTQPEAEPTAWQVDYDGEESESQYTVYGGVSRQEAIDKAVKIIKRDGRLPHSIYYKEGAF